MLRAEFMVYWQQGAVLCLYTLLDTGFISSISVSCPYSSSSLNSLVSFFFGFLHMVNLNLCLVPSFKMLMVMKVVRSPGMLAIIGLGGNLHILGHRVRVKFAYSGAWV